MKATVLGATGRECHTWTHTRRACATARPGATPAKINTTKVSAIPIIARPILFFFAVLSLEKHYFFFGSISMKPGLTVVEAGGGHIFIYRIFTD